MIVKLVCKPGNEIFLYRIRYSVPECTKPYVIGRRVDTLYSYQETIIAKLYEIIEMLRMIVEKWFDRRYDRWYVALHGNL